MQKFLRILVIKLRHHGDVLLTTPLISVLHQHFPEAEIHALVYKETEDMLRYNTQLKTVWTIDRKANRSHFNTRLSNEYQLLKNLRKQQFDLVIHLTESWRGAALSKLLHPKCSIAFDFPRRQNRYWKNSFTDLVTLPEVPTHNVIWQLSTLSPLGIAVNPAEYPLHLPIAKASDEAVKTLLTAQGWQNDRYVLIHPGSRWLFKCWEDDHYIPVIQTLQQAGHTVVLTAAPDEREQQMITNILAGLPSHKNIFSLAGQLSLAELAAAINHAKLFIGVDSVPMHMAAALQVPSVALFGPSKIEEWSPWQTETIILHAAQWGELPHPDAIDTSTSKRFLKALPTEAVIDAALAMLEKERHVK